MLAKEDQERTRRSDPPTLNRWAVFAWSVWLIGVTSLGWVMLWGP